MVLQVTQVHFIVTTVGSQQLYKVVQGMHTGYYTMNRAMASEATLRSLVTNHFALCCTGHRTDALML